MATMKLRCKLCDQEFISEKKKPKEACTEVSTKLATHIGASTEKFHKQFYDELQEINAELVPGVAWLLVLRCADIPEDQDFILDEQERLLDLITGWLGPDDDDDENDDDEPDIPTPDGLRERLQDYLTPAELSAVVGYVFGPQDVQDEPEADLGGEGLSKGSESPQTRTKTLA